jgi:hypothetical protein
MEDKMEFQEKRSLVNLITTPLLFIFYYLYVFAQYRSLDVASGTDLSFWAKYILILVPVIIIPKIIIYIIFAIINKIMTGDKITDMEDEMDKLIDLKASRNGSIVFMIGFMLAMVALVSGWSAHSMFIIIFGSFLVSGIFGEASMFYYYRKGV